MEDNDFYDIAADAPNARERAAALAGALRGKQDLSTILALSGSKAFAPAAQSLGAQAQRDEDFISSSGEGHAKNLRDLARLATEQKFGKDQQASQLAAAAFEGKANRGNQLQIERERTAAEERIAREKANEKNAPLFVSPGYSLSPGATPKPEELVKLREEIGATNSLKDQGKELLELLSSGKDASALSKASDWLGRTFNVGAQSGDIDALRLAMIENFKKANAFRSLPPHELKLFEQGVGQFTGPGNGTITDKKIEALTKMLENSGSKLNSDAQALGVIPPPPEAPQNKSNGPRGVSGAQQQSAAADERPIKKNKNTGERRYVNADGSLGEVVK